MRSSVFAALAVVLPLTLAPALAEEGSGTITEIDTANNTITLDDGSVYVLAPGVTAEGLKVGKTVMVVYDPGDNGALVASKVDLSD